MSTELYIVIYILVALVVAIFSRVKIFDYYDELGWAGAFGLFWPITVPIALFLIIVEKATTIITDFKEKSK